MTLTLNTTAGTQRSRSPTRELPKSARTSATRTRIRISHTGVILLAVLLILIYNDAGSWASLSTIREQVVLSADVSDGIEESSIASSSSSSPVDLLPKAFQFNNESSSSSLQSHSPAWNISVVVQLSGELGNHLSKIAFGYTIQQRLWQRYGVASHLILQHQERGSKWISARKDVQTCFPNFRSIDFTLGNKPEFHHRLKQQQQWLGSLNASKLVLEDLSSSEDVDEGLSYLYELLLRHQNNQSVPVTTTTKTTTDPSPAVNNNSITLPFLYTRSFARLEDIDAYYHGLRHLFAFDEDSCCRAVPTVDEHVFHFRNFLTEMPKRGKRRGFEESSPNQTVVELFQSGNKTGNHNEKKMVVMTTRFYNADAQAYLDAFAQSGWSTRIMQNQSGTQDFCFLKRAQRELVGMAKSTFVSWAALLGNATSVKLYSINSTETRAAVGEDGVFIRYRWKTPELRDRIQFVTITPSNSTFVEVNTT